MTCVLLTACGSDKNKNDASDTTATQQETTGKPVTDAVTDTQSEDTTGSPESDESTDSESETDETTESVPETEPEEPEEDPIEEEDVNPHIVPKYVNPLTGLATKIDVSQKRPVAIMVNNIGVSLPQVGIGQADVMFECLAEGGITRLMMLSTYYENFKKVGSVRSARDYYIDYSDGYNAIFIHAGGSPYAYDTIYYRGTNNIDGVNGPAALYYSLSTFMRDPDRLAQFAAEHTLVVKDGQGLVNAIDYYGYSTQKTPGYEEPMHFVEYGTKTVYDNKATHAKVVVSGYQTVDYVYNEDEGRYYRYQYNGMPHIDASTGEQLSFKNVVVMFTYTADIPGDDKSRIDIGTTGTGSGWYITEGSYTKITWRKDTSSSVLKFYYEDGTEVEMNRGKTMINVVPTYNADYVTFDNEWNG